MIQRKLYQAALLLALTPGCDDVQDFLQDHLSVDLTGRLDRVDAVTGTFEPLAPPKDIQLFRGNVAAADGAIYVIGGIAENFAVVGDVQIYDPSSDSWRAGPSWPRPRLAEGWLHVGRELCTTTASAYIGDFDEEPAFDCYDLDGDTWRAGAPAPGDRYEADFHRFAVLGDVLYFIGHEDGVYVPYAYDPALDRWDARATHQIAGCSTPQFARVMGDRIVAFGDDCYAAYVPALDQWEQLPLVGDVRPYWGGGQRLDVVGDAGAYGYLTDNRVWPFDLTAGWLLPSAPLAAIEADHFSGAIVADRPHVLVWASDPLIDPTVFAYQPGATATDPGTLESVASTPRPAEGGYSGELVVAGGELYAVGTLSSDQLFIQ